MVKSGPVRLHYGIALPVPRRVALATKQEFTELGSALLAVPRFKSLCGRIADEYAAYHLRRGIESTPWHLDVAIALRATAPEPDQLPFVVLKPREGKDDPGVITAAPPPCPPADILAPHIKPLLAQARYSQPVRCYQLWTALALMGYIPLSVLMGQTSPEQDVPVPLILPVATNLSTGDLVIPAGTPPSVEDFAPRLKRHVLGQDQEHAGGRPAIWSDELTFKEDIYRVFDLLTKRRKTLSKENAVEVLRTEFRMMPRVSERTLQDTAKRFFGDWSTLVAEYRAR